jgi:hypothetical protein
MIDISNEKIREVLKNKTIKKIKNKKRNLKIIFSFFEIKILDNSIAGAINPK